MTTRRLSLALSGRCRRLSLALMLAVLPALAAQALTPEQTDLVVTAVEYQVEAYPQSRLKDVYKSFFQDSFGPAHLVDDRAAAIAAIEQELGEIRTSDLPEVPFEAIGYKDQYYRVDLRLVKAGVITAAELVDAVIAGLEPQHPVSPRQWAAQWAEIYEVIRNAGFRFDDERADARLIDERLRAGDVVMHHSDAYERAYQPHYRLVRTDVFEKTLMPKLQELNFE